MQLMALWWWIDRWRKSSAYMDMTLEEQGAYRNLLDEAHLRGGVLPTDERILAKACGDALAWKRVRPAVMARFVLADDGWHNVTLDSILKESMRRATNQANYRARLNSASGNGAGNAPDNGTDNASNNNHHNNPASPSPSPDLISGSGSGPVSRTKRARVNDEHRGDVWLQTLIARYPPKAVSGGYLTGSAFIDVLRAGPEPPLVLFELMLANLETQKAGAQWSKGMVPKLQKWLREGLWRQVHEPAGEKAAPAPRGGALYTPAEWRTECRALGHEPACSSPERHALRLVVKARGCAHPGVCESLGACRTQR